MNDLTELQVTIVNNQLPEVTDQILKFKLSDEDERKMEQLKTDTANNYLKNAMELISDYPLQWQRLTTGCKIIDRVLGGGIPVVGITQIFGESSCGKTQICLQLSLTVQYPQEVGGFNAGCIFICTEDAFPSKRLDEICEYFPKQFPPPNHIRFKDYIFVDHVYNLEQLEICLDQRVPSLFSKQNIRLIIIDSIAGIFRYENYDKQKLFQRTQDMNRIAFKLEKLSQNYNAAVLCINQVTTKFENNTSKLIPALGPTWGRHVSTCIELTRNRDEDELLRKLNVIGAPDLPRDSCQFSVTTEGVIGQMIPKGSLPSSSKYRSE